jgi:hypothetical protein
VVDIDVTDRIEEAINTINGVKTITPRVQRACPA